MFLTRVRVVRVTNIGTPTLLVGINGSFRFRGAIQGVISFKRESKPCRLTQKTGKKKVLASKSGIQKFPRSRWLGPVFWNMHANVYVFFLCLQSKVLIKDRNRCHIVWARVLNTNFWTPSKWKGAIFVHLNFAPQSIGKLYCHAT